jgi:hypothetical protein
MNSQLVESSESKRRKEAQARWILLPIWHRAQASFQVNEDSQATSQSYDEEKAQGSARELISYDEERREGDDVS